MKKTIAFVTAGVILVMGCDRQVNRETPRVPTRSDAKSGVSPVTSSAKPAWTGLPFRIAFEPTAPGTSAQGITVPNITFTANPDTLPMSVLVIARYGVTDTANTNATVNLVRYGPVAISNTVGTITNERMGLSLTLFFMSEGTTGTGTVFFALAKTNLSASAEQDVVESNRLSEWLPQFIKFEGKRFPF